MCPPPPKGSLQYTLPYLTAKPTKQTQPNAECGRQHPGTYSHHSPTQSPTLFELRNLAQFIRPGDLAAGWAALGFDPINPRWGQNKITNQEGEKALGGRNSVIWIDLIIPPEGLNILGAGVKTLECEQLKSTCFFVNNTKKELEIAPVPL
eukprot:scaffold19645_cov140-Isochrysis_galbana.AAC.2